jgi:uncharacterized protein (TIGR02246 family)
MTRHVALLLMVFLAAASARLWAGPAEEVVQLAAPRGQAFEEGNLNAFTADFADNAVLQSFLSPFRIEGKQAIRAHYAELFQQYPKRRSFVRQPALRIYGSDLVIQNAYSVAWFTDQGGRVNPAAIRYSIVWAKMDGRWQIVDQHVSRVPVAP